MWWFVGNGAGSFNLLVQRDESTVNSRDISHRTGALTRPWCNPWSPADHRRFPLNARCWNYAGCEYSVGVADSSVAIRGLARRGQVAP